MSLGIVVQRHLFAQRGNSKMYSKVKGNESIMSSHPNTFKRVLAATENLRSNGIAPL